MEVTRELENPKIWDDPDKAQTLGRERAELERIVSTLGELGGGLDDAVELLQLAEAEGDIEIVPEGVSTCLAGACRDRV